ncbi:MAG: hypothetical protein KIS92_22670 [Planctomycetota bacterium]|nr:hypothetical protein [Planctomycetota bacterium]
MSKALRQWRQGDVMIEWVNRFPAEAKRCSTVVLASGDSTGHSHRMQNETDAWIFEDASGALFLQVVAESAVLEHDEHRAITIPRGMYRVWKQREFDPEDEREFRDVWD